MWHFYEGLKKSRTYNVRQKARCTSATWRVREHVYYRIDDVRPGPVVSFNGWMMLLCLEPPPWSLLCTCNSNLTIIMSFPHCIPLEKFKPVNTYPSLSPKIWIWFSVVRRRNLPRHRWPKVEVFPSCVALWNIISSIGASAETQQVNCSCRPVTESLSVRLSLYLLSNGLLFLVRH